MTFWLVDGNANLSMELFTNWWFCVVTNRQDRNNQGQGGFGITLMCTKQAVNKSHILSILEHFNDLWWVEMQTCRWNYLQTDSFASWRIPGSQSGPGGFGITLMCTKQAINKSHSLSILEHFNDLLVGGWKSKLFDGIIYKLMVLRRDESPGS